MRPAGGRAFSMSAAVAILEAHDCRAAFLTVSELLRSGGR